MLGGGPWTKQVAPPSDFTLISTGVPSVEVVLSDETRGLLVGVAGLLNVTMRNGSVHTNVPFQAGVTPGLFASIQAGGTAQNLWAVL